MPVVALDRATAGDLQSILMINTDLLGIGATHRLDGRRAVVTGAGSGIGKATAMRLVGAGAAVALFDIDRAAIEEVADLIRAAGGTATAVTTDVGDDDAVRSAVATAAEDLGGLDTIAACAGIAHPGSTHQMPFAAWETMLRVNLTGVFSTLRHGIPHLIDAGGGSIVTIGSVGSLVAAGQAAAYDASKGGVLQLTRAVAVEYVDHGIRANCVCPGKTKTSLAANSRKVTAGFDSSGSIRPAADRIDVPMPWFADPDLVATAVAFLVSDQAAFITGIAMPVDGGYTAV